MATSRSVGCLHPVQVLEGLQGRWVQEPLPKVQTHLLLGRGV